MKFKVFLKNTHINMLVDIIEKHDTHNKEELLKKCIKTALKLFDNGLITIDDQFRIRISKISKRLVTKSIMTNK